MDKILLNLIAAENARQNEGLELIASENFASQAVRTISGSILTNKYAEGFPGKRYYGGCQIIDQIEQRAIDLVCQLFGAKYANVQPHSGSQANMIAYYALLQPGDKILSLSLNEGGHLTHGSPVNFSAKYYAISHYHLLDNGRIDYEGLRAQAIEEKPKLILAGFSAYPYEIDFKTIKEIATEVGALFMVDMAHIAGLIAGGVHQNPVPYADIVTSTTHKTLRGPRGGIILTNSEEIITKVNKATFPGLQGGPLENIIAAKAQCFAEAMRPEFTSYVAQVVKNTKACAAEFADHGAFVSGTENHLFLLDTKKSYGVTGIDAENLLGTINVTVNKNMLPKDDERPMVTSGIRIGLAAVTTRGVVENDARAIALIIHEFLSKHIDQQTALKHVEEISRRLVPVEKI